jgi:Cu/Ag efflux protein CusF
MFEHRSMRRAADPTLLDRLKSGDRIVFTMTKAGGVFTVVEAERKD